MDRKAVVKEMKACTREELRQWHAHAVKCMNYYMKYYDAFEIEESRFIIEEIEKEEAARNRPGS